MPRQVYLPMGQVETEHDPALLARLKEDWFLKKVPSFEVWSAATCYDPTQPEGGKAFQAMMFWCLTDASTPNPNPNIGEVMFTNTGELASHMKQPKDRFTTGYKPGNYAPKSLHVTTSTATSASPLSMTGEKLGWHSGDWTKKTKDKELNAAKDLMIGAPVAPAGSLFWYESAGMSRGQKTNAGLKSCDAKGNSRQFKAPKVPKGSKTDQDGTAQRDGCMSFGNLLAAYFGLYYYPNCERDSYNWYHKQHICDTWYTIRMRLPNPAFEVEESSLRVNEMGESEILAGGFEFPALQGPVTCWDHLARREGDGTRAMLSPWAGLPGTGTRREDSHPGDVEQKKFGTRVREINWTELPERQTWVASMDAWRKFLPKKFKGRMFDRENAQQGMNYVEGKQLGGLAFGWCFPTALFLYPHSGKGYDSTGKGRVKEIPADQERYQPWPTWRTPDGWREFPYTVFDAKKRPLVDALEPEPVDKEAWALRLRPAVQTPAAKQVAQVTGTVKAARKPRKGKQLPVPDEPEKTLHAGEQSSDPVQVSSEQVEQDTADQLHQIDTKDTGPDELFSEYLENDAVGTKYDEVAGDLSKITDELQKKKAIPPLPAGHARREKDSKGNAHFFSLQFSPWPPDDVYEKPEHGFRTDRAMNAAEVAEYERLYGSKANLLLRTTKAGHVDFVEGRYGLEREFKGERILDMKLSSYRRKDLPPELKEMFRKNMRRIVSIYWDDSGHLANRISPDQKRRGMLKGMWMCKKPAKQEIHEVQYEHSKACKRILGPVFTKEPPEEGATTRRGQLAEIWRKEDFEYNVNGIVSEMTVLCWLQSPWHYEYLPYQPMSSVFKDGETYCVGCTRCSRPFYEYEHHYAPYFLSEDKTLHWVNQYWFVGNNVDKREAPQPFHDERFWMPGKANGWRPATATNGPDAVDQVFEADGYHNWPTYAFALGRTKDLEREWNLRKDNPKLEHLKKALQTKRLWTFRQYINHMWDKDKAEGKGYDELIQGAVRPNAKVAYGMEGYKLMRSVKYGNVCRDCMATLDLAPGQYHRTGRVVSDLQLIKGGKVTPGQMQLDTWWLQLKDTKLTDGTTFDPWYIYAHTTLGSKRFVYDELGLNDDTKRQDLLKTSGWARYKRMFEVKSNKEIDRRLQLHMDAVAALSNQKACKLQDATGQQVTKVVKPPEVYVQKVWDADSSMWQQKDSEQMEAATRLLDQLMEFLDGKRGRLTLTNDWRTAAVRDAITDVHYTMSHLAAYKRDVAAPQFDPDMTRFEDRGGAKLKIHQVVKPKVKVRRYREGSKVARTTYTDEVTRDWEYEWEGDMYVQGSADGKIPAHPEHRYQTRPMTQSRLFITYSLHRRVDSELEARKVLEKMADAVRCLFGNDQELCKILVFGMKLEERTMDAVSRKMYVPIERARKEDTVFYGGDKLNSYMYDTYESHVESVTVDVGVEIGPTLHHPHFHALLTVNHWSYVQVDTFKMKALFEQMFKGTHRYYGDQFTLIDGSGRPFYTDNENPYINIKVYPTDNWASVIAGYMRKGGERETMLALRARTEA